jgi:hypothetical protein
MTRRMTVNVEKQRRLIDVKNYIATNHNKIRLELNMKFMSLGGCALKSAA